MKTTNDLICEKIEDFICDLPVGRVINPFHVRAEVKRQMSIEPSMELIRLKLHDMTTGSSPEIDYYQFGQYIKLKVESNELLTV